MVLKTVVLPWDRTNGDDALACALEYILSEDWGKGEQPEFKENDRPPVFSPDMLRD